MNCAPADGYCRTGRKDSGRYFEGRELPPKALIKSIRVTRDQFAPEVHFAGELRIEILTQPGIGPIRGNVRSGFYDSAADGRNPLVGQRGPAQSFNYGFGLNGTLISRARRRSTSISMATTATRRRCSMRRRPAACWRATCRSARRTTTSSIRAVSTTRSRAIRCCGSNFNGSRFTRDNAGVGNFDLVERAYASEDSSFGLFIQQNGPIGRRMVLNTRLSVTGNSSVARSAIEAPTIVVNDWFTTGGAQRRGGSKFRNYWFNSDLDYVRGRHSMRTGIELQ